MRRWIRVGDDFEDAVAVKDLVGKRVEVVGTFYSEFDTDEEGEYPSEPGAYMEIEEP